MIQENDTIRETNVSDSLAVGLLAVDVDGTLLTDTGVLTDKVRTSLEKASDAGWEIVLASGRTYHAAHEVAKTLPFIRYAALSNGSVIVDVNSSQIIRMSTLEPGLVSEIIEVLRSHGVIPALYNSNQFAQRVSYDTLEDACDFFRWYVTHDSRCDKVDNVLDHTEDVLQIGSIAAKDRVFAVKEALKDHDVTVMTLPFESEVFGGKNLDFWFCQIVPGGATKDNAIRHLKSMLSIPDGRIVAVGDNYNDTGMIGYADVGVAMGNAPDEIKAVADLVVAPNSESGLAELVERVLLSGEYLPETD